SFEGVWGNGPRRVGGDGENGGVGYLGEPAADKGRVRQSGVVVPRKDHNRDAGFAEQSPDSVEDGQAQLIVLEGVPGQQNDIGSQRSGLRQYGTQARRAAPTVESRTAILVDIQIGAVDERRLARDGACRGRDVHRRSIAPASAGAQPRHTSSLLLLFLGAQRAQCERGAARCAAVNPLSCTPSGAIGTAQGRSPDAVTVTC